MKAGTRIKGMIGAACIAVMIATLAGTGGMQKVSADGGTAKPACQPVTGIEQRKETIGLRKAESARIHQQEEAERRAAEEARAQAIAAQKQEKEASQPACTKKAYATSSQRKSVAVNRYISKRRAGTEAEASNQVKEPSKRNVQPNGIRYAWTSLGKIEDIEEANRMVRSGLVEYRSNYFAADILTTVGKQIRLLRKGDIITVGGRRVAIDGEVYGNYRTDSLVDIQERVRAGYGEAVCFQTCVPPYHGPIVIKCGHYI